MNIGIYINIILVFIYAYLGVNKFIKYDICLLVGSINCDVVENVGFVCREIYEVKVKEIRLKYKDYIFITCKKSANLSSIDVKNFKETIFTTSGI